MATFNFPMAIFPFFKKKEKNWRLRRRLIKKKFDYLSRGAAPARGSNSALKVTAPANNHSTTFEGQGPGEKVKGQGEGVERSSGSCAKGKVKGQGEGVSQGQRKRPQGEGLTCSWSNGTKATFRMWPKIRGCHFKKFGAQQP